MKKLENFNSEKFLLKDKSAIKIIGGAIDITYTGKIYLTDKICANGEVECGGDTEIEHTDIYVSF